MRVLTILAAAGLASSIVALGAVDASIWLRTRRLRRGVPIRPDHRSPTGATVHPTGPATRLATAAGLSAALTGAGLLAASFALGAVLVAWGSFVAATGAWGRAVSVTVHSKALEVRHARRAPALVAWGGGSVSLVPPRTPAGGWRLMGDTVRGHRPSRMTIMPSDLFGHEDLLVAIIDQAGLSWDGRRWRGPSAREPAGAGSIRAGTQGGRDGLTCS